MKKRLIGIICLAAMAVSILGGCSSSENNPAPSTTVAAPTTAPNTTEAAAATAAPAAFVPKNTYKIGVNCYGSNSYALLAVAANDKVVIDAFDNEELRLYDNYSVETLMQDIENMLSSGIDGLIVWCPAAGMFGKIATMCGEAKVPFVISEKKPADDMYDTLQANPYFVGVVTPDNGILGTKAAQYALAQGYNTCILTSSQVGDPSDTQRINGFREAYEAEGGEVLAELHSDNSDSAVSQVQDSLIAYPDVDVIYGVGSSFGISAAVACENSQIEMNIITSGLESESLKLLGDGTYVEMVNGDMFVSATFGAILLQNYLDGTPILDENGKKPWITDIQPFDVPAEAVSLFNKCFIDEYCYSDAELQQMSGLYNPDFDYKAFVDALYSYSMEERFLAKYAEGKVSASELEAVGINP